MAMKKDAVKFSEQVEDTWKWSKEKSRSCRENQDERRRMVRLRESLEVTHHAWSM